ncbi:hypothetical protein Sulac_3081 [Sulfobacillus acidophilus DSM 10332]|uniref:Uncharacterized protein n=1 Tax=Sulfobacillus acidophilus (strain ATCC 700253 / DSM 10332 / NAL) TaxID=679936 RepID=G8U0Z0_SULAD|nr:hypothetical protein Sulac_3081 [Sulfobacillus acidophilus DSM 10332]
MADRHAPDNLKITIRARRDWVARVELPKRLGNPAWPTSARLSTSGWPANTLPSRQRNRGEEMPRKSPIVSDTPSLFDSATSGLTVV